MRVKIKPVNDMAVSDEHLNIIILKKPKRRYRQIMFDMYTLFYSPTISTSGNTQAVNPLYRYKDSITVVEDPTINALCGGFGNVMPWWLLGAKDDTDFIEVDYLNGQEIPTIRRMETPGTLGFVWDIYLDWGISVMDYRGAIKNPGIEVKNPIELA